MWQVEEDDTAAQDSISHTCPTP